MVLVRIAAVERWRAADSATACMYRYHEQDDVSPMPSATFSRWFRAHEVLKGREDKKEGERGHESVTQGLFQSRGAAFATTMAFELSSQSEALAVEPAADWKLVNTEEYTNICCYCSGGWRA